MHVGSLRALEFDRIVEVIRGFAQTPGGAVRLAALAPAASRREVTVALAATSETVRFLERAPLTILAPAELEEILEGLLVEGRALEPLHLLALASFLASVEAACQGVRAVRSGFPILAGVAARASSFEQEIAAIRRAVDPAGELLDDASPELRRIREGLRRHRTRLRGTLDAYLRGKDTAKYLQQQIVTDRHGRYVLVVRAEHRGAIPGIVHGSSGSGASLYLEPLNTVEINNEIVALQQQEAEEIHRILLALTDAFRGRAQDLDSTVEAATALDVLNARARFSMLVDGVAPTLADDDRLELRGARHPLLIPAVRRRLRDRDARGAAIDDPSAQGREPGGGADPVPVDILLVPPVRVLVITGPNTGGKTVALKTAGLLPLLAQAGLLIPAEEGSQVPVFRSVFADIGDEQSIAQSLSTFSGHIANIVGMDRALETPGLVLLDEAGAGTDPVEGGALAMAIIDHFRVRGAMVAATTHYDALKTYASTTAGATAAGFGFDPVTFAPTYTLNYGSPGSSLAFEIAGRLGLPASIIEGARARRSEREALLADHLARIERDRQTLEDERRLAARERAALADTVTQLQKREQEVHAREDALRRRLDRKIDERLREARREIDAVVGRLKARTETLAAQAERRAAPVISTGDTGGVRADARAAMDVIEERLRRSTSSAAGGSPASVLVQPAAPPAVGDRVLVGALRVEGTVRALQDRTADVDVRGKRLRARVDDLRVVAPAGAAAEPRVRVHVDLQPRQGSLTELNVVGCTVDEALTRSEKFLDDAVLTEQRSVRIVHGFGTGQLRRALHAWLQEHPSVARSAPARSDQGGGGATVVELKE